MPNSKGGLTIYGDGAAHSIIKYAKEWVTGGTWVPIRITPDHSYVSYELLTEQPENWDTDFGMYFKRSGSNDISYIIVPEDEFIWEQNKYYTKIISEDGSISYKLVSNQVNWEVGKYYTKLSTPKYTRLTSKPIVGNWANNTEYYVEICNYDKFLHDITIKDLGIIDTDPENHAQSEFTNITATSTGTAPEFAPGEVFDSSYNVVLEEPADWATNYSNYYKQITIEETHGVDIQYCYRAKVLNCNIINVGDEAIDMHSCIDSLVQGNSIIGSPAIGAGGGAISIGDGCDNVVVSNNSVNGSQNKKYKTTFGIAVESLHTPVNNIVISNNTITNINGNGINIGATSDGANINKVIISNNVITNSKRGINLMGSKLKSTINIDSCIIDNAEYGIFAPSGVSICDLLISNFNITNCLEDAIRIVTDTSLGRCCIYNGIIRNMQTEAIYCALPHTKIDNILIDGTGLIGNLEVGAIRGSTKSIADATRATVSNTTILNCRNRKGIENIHSVINTIIDQEETKNHRAISNVSVIRGGKVNRLINAIQNNGIIDGLTIQSKNGTDFANTVIGIANKTGVRITNCLIDLGTNTINRKAIAETGTSNNNIIANNIIKSAEIAIIGKNTINKDNIIIPKP